MAPLTVVGGVVLEGSVLAGTVVVEPSVVTWVLLPQEAATTTRGTATSARVPRARRRRLISLLTTGRLNRFPVP
jgi:hypothetical protein